jgi:UDP-N-acetylmuramate: L-alanyl-gamma-D-glutamyl-meso-diaminopimelate ligase
MLAWILEAAGLEPGFLVGGVPLNFGVSARLGKVAAGHARNYFVIEADEYDTAFFDKRSKFVHYRPRTAVLNNLEFDHADIFDDLPAIERQFHHLVRTVPGLGRLVVNGLEESLTRVLAQGCWSEVRSFGAAVSDFSAIGEPSLRSASAWSKTCRSEMGFGRGAQPTQRIGCHCSSGACGRCT